ncbi:glycosyltransferase family 4 protein [Dyella sp.]|jgi:glycosyltransferase involved in cell wall biosynthesis|uniref:glycosyltransferase family 4 protein n=1 Tax=Dyella sp. TaxID=1869338 RepID=UPI002D79B973|nr:glycosyltransferase family 4 protein [Dyella sp.]HET6430609.1 glycosyltransferase family 4 protein [Dyella sp.]
MARIQLLAWHNRRGLSHDLELMAHTLAGLGHRVHITRLGPRRNDGRWLGLALRLVMHVRRVLRRDMAAPLYDANIALEHVRPAFFALARINLLVPNPEWLSPRSQRYLSRFDAILCKTRHARELFAARGQQAIQIGFDSEDSRLPAVPRQRRFLHLAGGSPMKGTRRLIALWERHPEWPELLVLRSGDGHAGSPASTAANVRHRVEYLSREELQRLQNEHAFHVCLSETEGWGHYIAEAMGCGAIVVTCDAPPMNELVRPERGVLVAARPTRAFNMAQLYEFDEQAMEAAMQRLIDMPEADIAAMSANARGWFEDNHHAFAARLDAALRTLL